MYLIKYFLSMLNIIYRHPSLSEGHNSLAQMNWTIFSTPSRGVSTFTKSSLLQLFSHGRLCEAKLFTASKMQKIISKVLMIHKVRL